MSYTVILVIDIYLFFSKFRPIQLAVPKMCSCSPSRWKVWCVSFNFLYPLPVSVCESERESERQRERESVNYYVPCYWHFAAIFGVNIPSGSTAAALQAGVPQVCFVIDFLELFAISEVFQPLNISGKPFCFFNRMACMVFSLCDGHYEDSACIWTINELLAWRNFNC